MRTRSTIASFLLLGASAGASEPETPAPTAKLCYAVKAGKFVPCPVNRAPPNICDSGEHCDDTACWCGPTDAYMGPDQTGLPFMARALEHVGFPCFQREEDGAVSGDCKGRYAWSCDADGRCMDDIGYSWRPAGVSRDP